MSLENKAVFSELTEKQLSREEIFRGKVLHLVNDTVLLPNGEKANREICLHVGAVCIIPILPDGRVIMERQFRYAHGRVFFEIPAGKLDSVYEDPLSAAKRELREETGAIAGKMTYLGELDTSPALVSEKIHMYLAEELTFGERELDEDEFLNVEYTPLKSLYNMVMSGEIRDAKTQIAVMKAAALRPEYLK
ncbi:MAG: NUDIX hydrolase [Clostridia bacterium]|nr:NUDIX hydrolase [Clostridia bacterium]